MSRLVTKVRSQGSGVRISAGTTHCCATQGVSSVAVPLLVRVRLGRECDVRRPAALSVLCLCLVAGRFFSYAECSSLRCAVRLRRCSAADGSATCAILRALFQSVLLSRSESVLLSCSNSLSWPTRSSCRVSVVTHTCGERAIRTRTDPHARAQCEKQCSGGPTTHR